jgi:hypothetical protein
MKKKITPAKKKLKLPSLSDFERLPLSKRQRLFERWVATQPKRKPVNYHDIHGCPLYCFGLALCPDEIQSAGADNLTVDCTVVPVVGWEASTALLQTATYGELSKRLRAPRVSALSKTEE